MRAGRRRSVPGCRRPDPDARPELGRRRSLARGGRAVGREARLGVGPPRRGLGGDPADAGPHDRCLGPSACASTGRPARGCRRNRIRAPPTRRAVARHRGRGSFGPVRHGHLRRLRPRVRKVVAGRAVENRRDRIRGRLGLGRRGVGSHHSPPRRGVLPLESRTGRSSRRPGHPRRSAPQTCSDRRQHARSTATSDRSDHVRRVNPAARPEDACTAAAGARICRDECVYPPPLPVQPEKCVGGSNSLPSRRPVQAGALSRPPAMVISAGWTPVASSEPPIACVRPR